MLKKIYAVLDRKQRRETIGILIMILIDSGLELLGVSAVLPLITAITDPESMDGNRLYDILRSVISHISGESDNTHFVAFMAIILAALYVIKNLYIMWMYSVFYKFTTGGQRDIALRLTGCYIHQDYSFHVEHNVAELQRNVGTDVGGFFATVLNLMQLCVELIVCFMLVVYLALTDIGTTLIVAGIMALLLLFIVFLLKKRIRFLGESSRRYTVRRTKAFFEAFQGIKEIKASGKEAYFLNRYKAEYEGHTKVIYKQSLLNNIMKPAMEMCLIGGILIYMAVRILAGEDMQHFVPVMSVFAVAAFRMMPSINRISGYMNNIMFNKASVDAVYDDMLEMESLNGSHKRENNVPAAISFNKGLTLENISFFYQSRPEHMVLKDISLTIPLNSSVAFVGASGAGKTTLVDIILGIYRPVTGRVLADDVNVHEQLDAWHAAIAYIPQTIYLMDESIRTNIAFGVPEEEIDDERVWEVLEEAQLADFVREQPEGLDTNIGEGGVRISGGQRQRIGIARALYSRPKLLILDEATSALDSETETAVMDAIYRLSGRITMIIIAHRITTIKSCDCIYRIENTHAEKISYEEA